MNLTDLGQKFITDWRKNDGSVPRYNNQHQGPDKLGIHDSAFTSEIETDCWKGYKSDSCIPWDY